MRKHMASFRILIPRLVIGPPYMGCSRLFFLFPLLCVAAPLQVLFISSRSRETRHLMSPPSSLRPHGWLPAAPAPASRPVVAKKTTICASLPRDWLPHQEGSAGPDCTSGCRLCTGYR
ncbi:hypothetical protein GGR56DRAFT_651995 [Xylariaceae sp. FL0804]|nr:hypothetical protein GGR56DRAFT_651995 [Xylariaceae sp. FL0804]